MRLVHQIRLDFVRVDRLWKSVLENGKHTIKAESDEQHQLTTRHVGDPLVAESFKLEPTDNENESDPEPMDFVEMQQESGCDQNSSSSESTTSDTSDSYSDGMERKRRKTRRNSK